LVRGENVQSASFPRVGMYCDDGCSTWARGEEGADPVAAVVVVEEREAIFVIKNAHLQTGEEGVD